MSTKTIALFYLSCLCSFGVTPVLIDHGISAANSSSPQVVSVTLNCSGANAYYVGIGYDSGVAVAVTDSQGSTYTPISVNGIITAAAGAVRLYYALGRAGGSVTISVDSRFQSVAAACFSNVASHDSSSDVVASDCAECVMAAITPAQADTLLITAEVSSEAGNPAVLTQGGYTLVNSNSLTSGQHYGVGLAYRVTTGTSPVTTAWLSQEGAAIASAFNPGTSSGSPTAVRRRVIL